MSNELTRLEKELRSFAKRCKNIKYTGGLLLSFLFTGMLTFSVNVDSNIVNARKDLNTSINDLHVSFKQAKRENNRLLKNANLELIQLMEQGDHVVKSPWSSWQIGMNYFYSNWRGAYKGRGDKAQKYPYEGIFERSTNAFERYTSPLSPSYEELNGMSNIRNGLNQGYGIASTTPKQEPLAILNVDASIKPKDVFRDAVNASTVSVQAPNLPPLNVPSLTSPPVSVPTPNVPEKTVSIVKPNASPFTGFFFDGSANAITKDNSQGLIPTGADVTYVATQGVTLYSGVEPSDINANKSADQMTPAAKTGYIKSDRTIVDVSNTNTSQGNKVGRTTNILYRSGYTNGTPLTLKDLTLHVRGNFDRTDSGGTGTGPTDSYTDVGRGAEGGADTGGPTRGTIGIHTLLNANIENTTANLYGRAGFVTSETWRNGVVNMVGNNNKVNVYGSENSVFYIMPSAYGTITYGYSNSNRWAFYLGKITGKTNIDIFGTGNNVYLSSGISGARHIENDGVINSYGASNIVYSGMSYVPDWSKSAYQTMGPHPDKMQSKIQLSKVNLYGDENVGMFFGSKMGGNNPKSWEPGHRISEDGAGYIRKASYIGIYQGEIDFAAKIGTQLGANASDTAQASVGNLTGNSDKWVEGGVGVFAQSGQREGIDPIKDLGVPSGLGGDYAQAPTIANDKIHALQVRKLDVTFGKNSKNGFMLISKLGSVIDVGNPASSNDYVTGISSTITDGVNGANTNETDASTGTVIAYAEGTWDQAKHQLGSKAAEKTQNDNDAVAVNNGTARKPLTDIAASTAAKLQGLASEINVYPDVVLASKEGIAYMGDNQGIVNAKKTTVAVSHSAIIGFARNKGTVNIDGDITALDAKVTNADDKYKNIAGLATLNTTALSGATVGGTVNINGNVNVNGMGALASGSGSTVNLNKTGNIINIGKEGGLAAVKGGKVNFAGGTINVGDDRSSSTPVYADNDPNSSVTFKDGTTPTSKPTTINMSSGILMTGEDTDYSAAATGVGKYKGMKNVKVVLQADGVVLKTSNGKTVTWNGSTAGSTAVKNAMKLGELDTNNKKFKIFYINGTFNLATNLNLDDATDEFNKSLGLSNEVFNIGSGVIVSSGAGKGLAMGSNDTATSNASNAYNNDGTINITSGTANTSALNISYGTVDNRNIINVDKGIGVYGINGSRLVNDTNGTITVGTEGVGMAGFSSASTLQVYGTDKKIKDGTLASTDKTLELLNKGTITVNGNNSVGMYGETNKAAGAHASTNIAASNGLITNSGKITMTGNNAVGIVSKGFGNKINLSGTGSSDIATGVNGIGVYAEKSDINLLSNYGMEVKDQGTGIFVKDGSSVSAGTLELKYNGSNTGTGVGIFYEGSSTANMLNKTNVNLVDNTGTTGGLVGLFANNGGILTNTGNIAGDKGYGIITSGTEIVNNGNITLNNPVDNATKKASVGIYTQGSDKITNNGIITAGENSVGIFGYTVVNTSTVNVGNGGTGIYSTGGNVDLLLGAINTGTNKAVAVYTKGNGQTVTAHNGSTLNIGDNSFGFINEGTGNTINSNISSQSLGTDTVYIYSTDRTGTVTNNTALTSTGSYNYGMYSAGTVTNNADINFGAGLGNVGIYSTHGGTATNSAGRTITIGKSFIDPDDVEKNRYGVGMAAGFTPTDLERLAGKTDYTGNIVNNGTINVTGQYSIGMYGTGAGTKVYNGTAIGSSATINLGASNTTGMYLDNGAYGYNYGTIKTVGTALEKVAGVVVRNGSTIENHGDIILDAKSAVGLLAKGDVLGNNLGIIKNYKNMMITGEGSVEQQEDTNNSSFGKGMGGVSIDVPKGSSTGTINVNGKPVVPTLATTTGEEYQNMNVSRIGMYIDTSSKRFTRPIAGLSNLSSLRKADLIIGAEAAKNTTSKYIQLDKKILDPYNDMIKRNTQIKDWKIYSGSLTWMATVAQNQTDGTMENAYMAKIPYTQWAGKEPMPVEVTDTYNFLDGLEQRYGIEGLGTREKALFDKISGIGKNEQRLFYQAIDEMMGHQYANVQQRINGTGKLLDKEIIHLGKEWDTKSKQSNKIKVFGMRDEYKTDTAGIINYTSNAYGFAYLHEDETIKLGNSSGWYAGAVNKSFKFKDIGGSKENTVMLKLGMFKSTAFDNNGSLKWTVSGEGYVARTSMHRKYLVVDEIFEGKSDYNSHGAAIKNEISKEFRTSERTSIKPYGSLKLEYGRFNTIKEKTGEVRLEVKGNDYYSVKPEVGIEFKYRQPMAVKTTFVTTLGLDYENELGKVGDVKNKGRVAYTDADWFNIRGEKDDRKGNFKADLNIGIENQRFGITLNGGYDTKGKNVRGGLGFRVIY